MFYGGLLDKNRDRCESLTKFSHPVVRLQCGESSSDRFVEGLGRHLHRVFNVLKILDRNCARSEDHNRESIMFRFLFANAELYSRLARFLDVSPFRPSGSRPRARSRTDVVDLDKPRNLR